MAFRSRSIPGIGYDIIATHPMFNGAAIGRAAEIDFRQFAGAVETLDGGVVLSVGSAIMGPQVFEKSLSCVNNLRIQAGRPIVRDHSDLRGRSPGRRQLGLGDRASRPRPIRPTICASARATRAWAGPCTIANATISPSSTTCITPLTARLGQGPRRPSCPGLPRILSGRVCTGQNPA